METETLKNKLDELRALPKETEWVEFKVNYVDKEEIGKLISALSNSACLHREKNAYLVYGIEDETHKAVGTNFKPTHSKVGNEELENWLTRSLTPKIDFRIYEFKYKNKTIAMFEINPTQSTPVKFKNIAYIRIGSYTKKLSYFPEKERKIWKKEISFDCSAQICEDATINDLDQQAIQKAREQYKRKFPEKVKDIDTWDDITFLNKAKVTIQGNITKAAIILLGEEESEHFISPSVVKISWILKDANNIEKDYEHFGPPFILNVEQVFSKVRNLKYRYLPDATLFPIEITTYDPWVIREALHNCIAHQDYELRGKINLVEKPDELLFTNVGSFIPGDVETVIKRDSPPEVYRNRFLADAMFNLNMIDTIGGGIKKMFKTQKERFFPLPDYDLTKPEKVVVKIPGTVLNENYTKLLIHYPDMDLDTVMLLDKVQKGIHISKDERNYLKSKRLVEGRYPNLFVASHIAAATEEKAKYIKYRAFDDQQYKNMIISFIKKYGSASREEINELLLKHLSDALNQKQRQNKISNLLYAMAKKDKTLKNIGSNRKPKWILNRIKNNI